MKWAWMSVGFGAGFFLGAQAGKERVDRFVHWPQGTAEDIGLTSASERIIDSAKSAGADLYDAGAARSEAVLGHAADTAAEGIGSVGEYVRTGETGA